MKLRNSKDQMVRIRLPKQRINFEMKPFETLDIDLKTRQALIPYLQTFGLILEADNADYHPAATIPETQPKAQEPPHVRAPVKDEKDEPTAKEMEGLLFDKTVEEAKPTADEESGTSEEPLDHGRAIHSPLPTPVLTMPDEEPGSSTEPDYGREYDDSRPDPILTMDEDGSKTVKSDDEEVAELYEKLVGVPEECPYTKSELHMKVKSELWEICEKLGLSDQGTKNNLIESIINFYDNK